MSPQESDLATIRSTQDIARFFGVTPNFLSHLLYSHRGPKYQIFKIPKKRGGFREIASPPREILLLQRRLLDSLTKLYHPKSPVHGFVSNRSVVTNARTHVGSKWILNLDLDNFFPSIHFGRVRGVFQKFPFSLSPSVSSVLAHLCCLNGKLPQGAPTSPLISNYICRGLDQDLFDLARRYKIKYTRYADDLTFSTNTEIFPPDIVTFLPDLNRCVPIISDPINKIIVKHGFKINPLKTRIDHMWTHQRVTGLTVNQKVNVRRSYIRNIRAIIYDIEKNGYVLAETKFQHHHDHKYRKTNNHPSLKNFLKGKLDFLKMVKGETDQTYLKYAVKAEKYINSKKNGVTISGSLGKRIELLKPANWVLLGKNAKGIDVVQASAFSLKGWGIITARHVFESPEAQKASRWVIFNGDNRSEFQLNGYLKNDLFDLTILNCDVKHIASFRVSSNPIRTGQNIYVIGFPRWSHFGDDLSSYPAKIVRTRTVSTVSYIETNADIGDGNSGGPVLDGNGEVIGVAIYGNKSPISPNSAISINHLDQLSQNGVPIIF